MGEMIEFAANGGACPGYLVRAERPDAPGVVVLQEWWGLNHNIKSITERFAAAGYTALAPDLYRGQVATEPDEARKLLMGLNLGEAAKDMRGAIRYLKDLTGRPVGTVGFCMGGALSLYAACENGRDVAACVDFYGGNRAHNYRLEALEAPVLGLFAELDQGVSPEFVRWLDEELTRLGKPHDFTIYPGAHHAFFNDERPSVYNPEASADAWQKVLAFYARHLGGGAPGRAT